MLKLQSMAVPAQVKLQLAEDRSAQCIGCTR